MGFKNQVLQNEIDLIKNKKSQHIYHSVKYQRNVCLQEIIFSNLGSRTNLIFFRFLVPPSEGHGVKKFEFKFFNIFFFDI